MNLAAIHYANLLKKLEWSSEGEWSAHVTPEECQLLLKLFAARDTSATPLEAATKPKGCKCQNRGTEKETTPSWEFAD